MIQARLVLIVALLAAEPATGHAGRLLPDPHAFLTSDAGLTAADLGSIEQGRVIAKVVDTGDASEVMAVGVMRVHATAAEVLARLRGFEGRRRPEDVISVGMFGSSPSPADLARLTLDGNDLGALRKCKVGGCDVRLPAWAIARVRREVDWSSPRAAESATALWRELLAGFTATYLSRGNAGLVEYDNNDMPVKVGDSLARVLALSSYLEDSAPDLFRYLQQFPAGRPGEAEDYLYWVKERFWIKTVVSLNHVTIVSAEASGRRFVLCASKQLYANRYFESSLGLTLFIEGRGGSDLVYVSRSRADIRPSGFNFFERLLLRRLVQGRLSAQLQWLRSVLEPAPRRGASTPRESPSPSGAASGSRP